MSIDLGNEPVGTPPTDIQKTQLRASLGLGATDTVEFGALIPPAGTTAEIDAVTNSEVGSVVINSDTNQSIQFTSANEYKYIGSLVSRNQYFVDPTNGDDTKGKAGVFPFATVNASIKGAIADGQTTISIICLPAVYSEEDAFNGVVTSNLVNITFEDGCIFSGAGTTLPFFDNTTANVNINSISGSLFMTALSAPFWRGPMSTTLTTDVTIAGVSAWSTTEHLFEITGGSARINFKKSSDSGTQARYTWFKVSGDADVTLEGIVINNNGVQGNASISPLAFLSDTATLKINNARVLGHGLCEITTDTSCKLIVSNCVSAAVAAPPFLNQVPRSISATTGSSNPQAFAIGDNLVSVAPDNITVNVDGGTFTASTTALTVLS